jgi:hypothetical protein
LTGQTEILRSQTQKRIDEAFVGIDTSRDTKDIERISYIGVGKIRHEVKVNSFTSVNEDFVGNKNNNVMSLSETKPTIFVLKKNGTVLYRLYKWLLIYNSSSSNKKIKAIGAKRLAGIAFSQSLKFGLMNFIGTVLRGGDDDEEDELNKNVRRFVPSWSKSSDLTLIEQGGGKFSYIDFSASDPHGGIKKAYNSFMAGEGAVESFTNGMAEILGPFVKRDMLLEALTDVSNNENAYGGKLYNETDTNVNKINAVAERLYKVIESGTMVSARKIAEAENVGNELAGQLTGYKIITIDVEKQFGIKMSEAKDKITEGPRKLYNSAFREFEKKKITIEELKATYDQANSEQKEIYKDIISNIKAASFFGVDDYIIDDSMDGLGKDVVNDLWYGEAPDLKEKQVKLTDAEFKKKFGEKAFNLMLRGRKLMKKGAK